MAVRVIVHGDVPPEIVEEVRKLGEEMGVDEINVGNPDSIEGVIAAHDAMKDDQVGEMRVLTKDRSTGILGLTGRLSKENAKELTSLLKSGNLNPESISPELKRALTEALGGEAEWAEIPYNGVDGDSCDCPACNARRKFDGPELGRDREMGIPPRGAFGPGKDVAGTPMMKLPGFEGLQTRSRDEALKGIDELLDVVRKKQDNHFKLCDKLADILTEVRRLVAEDRPFETIAKMKEVDELLSDLKK